jgi:hypothetical protein
VANRQCTESESGIDPAVAPIRRVRLANLVTSQLAQWINEMLDFDLRDYSFECAAVLPEQFFADRHKFGEPIKRLMFAVLNDAIRCYQTNVGVQRPHAQRLLAETKEWLFRLSGDAPFSFESICEVLEIDAPRLQRALLRWCDLKLAGCQPRGFARRCSVIHEKRLSFLNQRDSAA